MSFLVIMDSPPKIKIAVIVRQYSDQLLLKSYLEELAKCELLLESRGDTAFEKLKIFVPRLILMDVFLEGMGGIQLCRELRSFETFKKTIIVGFLRHEKEKEMGNIPSAGFDYFLVKPLYKIQIRNILKKAFPLDVIF